MNSNLKNGPDYDAYMGRLYCYVTKTKCRIDR